MDMRLIRRVFKQYKHQMDNKRKKIGHLHHLPLSLHRKCQMSYSEKFPVIFVATIDC